MERRQLAHVRYRDHNGMSKRDELSPDAVLLDQAFNLDVCGFVLAESDTWLVIAQEIGPERIVAGQVWILPEAIVYQRRWWVGVENDTDRRRGA